MFARRPRSHLQQEMGKHECSRLAAKNIAGEKHIIILLIIRPSLLSQNIIKVQSDTRVLSFNYSNRISKYRLTTTNEVVVLDFCDSVYFHTLSWLCIPSWDMNDGPVSGGMNVSVPSIISIPVLKGCSQGGRCCMLPLFPTNVMHGEVVYLSYYSVTTKYLSASDYNIPKVLHPEDFKTWNPCVLFEFPIKSDTFVSSDSSNTSEL